MINVLYINHTKFISGADYSIGYLMDALSPQVKKIMLIRKSSISKEHFKSKCEIEETNFMPIFMTTPRTQPYPLSMLLYQLMKLPVSFAQILKLKFKYNLDILHLNESDLIAYAFIGYMLGLKVIIHARGAIADERKLIFKLFIILSRKKSIHLVGIDNESVDSFPAEFKKHSSVLYNPVVMGEFNQNDINNFKKKYNFVKDDIIIAQFAALHKEKGIWEIIELMERIIRDHKNVKFIFVGDDRPGHGEGPKLKEIVRHKGLEKNIVFTGYIDDVSKIYNAVDIVICMFGKYLRGVGRTAFEAAVSGKPLLATLPGPGSSETVINNITGLVFKPEDEDGIYMGLKKLIEDKEYRLNLGASAKNKIGDRHNPVVAANQIQNIYKNILSIN